LFLGTAPFNYSWSPIIDTSAGPITVCPTADTTVYSVTVTDALGAVDTDTAIVIKNPKFTLSTSSSDVGCRVNNDGRAWVYVNGGVAPFTYNWSNGAAGPADSMLTTGQYSVIVTDALGCTDSAVVTINQKAALLQVSIDKDSLAICYGTSVTLTASGADTYNWSPATGLSNDVGNVVVATPLSTTIYQVIGTDTSGCMDTAYTHIFVSAPIQLSFLTTKATCLANDGSITTTVAGGKAPFTYAWNYGQTTKDLTAMPVGKYYVTVTDSIGCQQTDTVLISNFNKGFPVKINPSRIEVCNGDTVLLKVAGGGLKQWFTQGNFVNSGDSIKVRPDQTGSYLVLVTDSLGCIDSSSVVITVDPKPVLNIYMADREICLNQAVTLSVSGANNYSWSSNIGNYHGNTVTVKPDHTDTYTVFGTDGKGCVSDTASALITVHPLPQIDIGQDTALDKGIKFKFNPSYPSNIVQWKWSPDINISCTNCDAPEITALRPVKYYLSVTDKYGCTTLDSIQIMLTCSGEFIQIPSGFTPNGDGNNDFFRPTIGADITVKYFQVFNRWGEMMYSVKDFNSKGQTMKGWDGRFKGIMQAQGAYVFTLEVVCQTGEHNFYKGTFVLIQ
jgi:gliding motility-associated-like protein